MSMLQSSWREVSFKIIANCLGKIGFSSRSVNKDVLDSEKHDLWKVHKSAILPKLDAFDDYVSIDDEVITSQNFTEEELIKGIKQSRQPEVEGNSKTGE